MEKFTHVIFDHDGTLVDTTGLDPYIFEGIADLVKTLEQKGLPLYVWTARSKVSTNRILDGLNLRNSFKDICGSDTASLKPSTAGLEYLVPEAKPENVIVIGDSMGDIMGAKNFGGYAVGVTWSHGNNRAKDKFIEAGANQVFNTVVELKEFLLARI